MTAQAEIASTADTSGASRKTPLLAPDGMIGSLKTNFSRSAKACSVPQGPTTLGTAAQLHRRPYLAVGVEDVGDEDQQHDDQHDRLEKVQQRRQHVKGEESIHAYSAACLKPLLASAEHSAITADARAIGLVR